MKIYCLLDKQLQFRRQKSISQKNISIRNKSKKKTKVVVAYRFYKLFFFFFVALIRLEINEKFVY